MKSSQSNLNLRSPSSHLVRSYLITTVPENLGTTSVVLVIPVETSQLCIIRTKMLTKIKGMLFWFKIGKTKTQVLDESVKGKTAL